MTKPHVIDALAFEIAFDTVQAAREQQDGLAAWTRDALLPVIDELFDAYAVPGQQIKIDVLELDLGTVPYEGYQQALRQRLKSRLKDWLETHCAVRRQAGPAGTVRIVSNDQDDVEQLIFFLRNGRLSRHSGGAHVDPLMQRVLRHSGEQLAALLANIARRETVVRRLAHQFSEEVLIEVLRCVVPAHAGMLGVLIADLSDVLANNSGVAQSSKTRRRMLWGWLLSAVLVSPSRPGNLHDIVTHVMTEAARYCGLAYPALLDRLCVHLDRRSRRDSLSLALRACLDALRTRVTEGTAEAVAEARSDPPLARLKRRWIKALTVGGSADIERLWPALRPYPDMTVETLRRYGQRVEVRAKLSADLSATVLEEMVTSLEPGEHRFIAEIVEHETLFHAEAGVDRQGGERVKRQLWAFTLDYLLADRGSQFNRRSYLDSVLRSRAAHDNVSHSELLYALTDVLEHVDAPSPLKQALLELLGEFAERDGQASPLSLVGEDDDSTPSIPARDGVGAAVTAQRRDALAGGRGAPENGPGSEGHVAGPAHAGASASLADGALLSKQQPVTNDRLSARPDGDDGAIGRQEQRSGGGGRDPAGIDADDYRDVLLTAWLNGERVALSSTEIEAIIRALHRIHPAQLLKVYQALQAGAPDDGAMEGEPGQSTGGGERAATRPGATDRFDWDVLKAWLNGERVALSSTEVEAIIRALRCIHPAQLLKVCEALQAGARDDGAMQGEPGQFTGGGERAAARPGATDRFDWDVLKAWLNGERVAPSSTEVEAIIRALRRIHSAQLLKVCEALQAGARDDGAMQGEPGQSAGGGERAAARPGETERFDWDVLKAWLNGERVTLSSTEVEAVIRALRRTHPVQLLKVYQALQAGAPDDGAMRQQGQSAAARPGATERFDWDVLMAWLNGERIELSSTGIEAITRALRRTPTAQLLKIYRVLRARKPDDGAMAPQEEEPSANGRERNPAFIDAYDRYDLLIAWLRGERGTLPSSEVEALIQALCRAHPVHLLKFYRALQAGELAVARLGQGVSAEALCLLVNAFIGMSDKSASAQPSDLLRAVEACARQAGNRHHYYFQVLQCLVANRLPDFERIVAASQVGVRDERKTDRAQLRAAPPVASASSAQGGLSVAAAKALLTGRLRAEASATGRRPADVVRALDVLCQHAPAALAGVLASLPGGVDAFVKRLAEYPERVWVRIALALYPGAAHLIAMAESIATALYSGAAGRSPSRVTALKWHCFFHCLAGGARIPDDAAFIRGFVAELAKQLAVADRNAFIAQLSQQLLLDMLPSTADLHRRLVTFLSSMLPGGFPDHRAANPGHADPQFTETIWLANAGLVLLSPYLPRLFALLGVLDGTAFKHDEAAGWAVHALQYLVDERCDAPEHELVLNKILCGLSTAWPVMGEIELSDEQRGIADSLLQGVIDNWTAIGRTSVAGLRESFLQREGRLQFRRDAWRLTVIPRAYDMLLDRLPWSISLIRQPWMTHAVHVDWR